MLDEPGVHNSKYNKPQHILPNTQFQKFCVLDSYRETKEICNLMFYGKIDPYEKKSLHIQEP